MGFYGKIKKMSNQYVLNPADIPGTFRDYLRDGGRLTVTRDVYRNIASAKGTLLSEENPGNNKENKNNRYNNTVADIEPNHQGMDGLID